jgi:hypothetical protein
MTARSPGNKTTVALAAARIKRGAGCDARVKQFHFTATAKKLR